MPRKQKKYHYIYKTTNVINGKYYIGMHSTDNLNDGYMGSGKRLWNSIKYHGKENHVCEILEYCESREELSKREEQIVNEELLAENLCLNLVIGGCSVTGGFKDGEHMMKFVKAGREGTNKVLKERFGGGDDWISKYNSYVSKKAWGNSEYRKNKIESLTGENNSFYGKQHTEESKIKMSESSKGQGKGEMNSQYGTCWITNEKENIKIKRGNEIPEGFKLGRKMK